MQVLSYTDKNHVTSDHTDMAKVRFTQSNYKVYDINKTVCISLILSSQLSTDISVKLSRDNHNITGMYCKLSLHVYNYMCMCVYYVCVYG